MTKQDIQQAIKLLDSEFALPANITTANNLVTQSGLRNSEIQTALYFSLSGDPKEARKHAVRAANQLREVLKTIR